MFKKIVKYLKSPAAKGFLLGICTFLIIGSTGVVLIGSEHTKKETQRNETVDTINYEVGDESHSLSGEDRPDTTTTNSGNTVSTTVGLPTPQTTTTYQHTVVTTTTATIPASNSNYCYDLLVARQTGTASLSAKVNEALAKMNNLESDLRARTAGQLITEAQFQALYAQEYQALYADYLKAQSEYDAAKRLYPVC